MIPSPFTFCSVTVLGMFLVLILGVPNAEAQVLYRPSLGLQQQVKSEVRQTYRPHIQLIREAGASRSVKAGQPLVFEYYARRGWVSRIEVRSGSRVIKTIQTGQSQSGGGKIVLNSSDLPVSFGKRSFTLWAWQGRPSYQSIHGQSIGYTLID